MRLFTGRRLVRTLIPLAVGGVLVLGQPVPTGAVSGAAEFGADGSKPLANGGPGDYTMKGCSPTQRYDQYTGEVATGQDGSTKYEPPSTSGVDLIAGINESHDSFQNGHGAGAASYYFLVGPTWAVGGPATTQAEATAWGQFQADRYTAYYNDADEFMTGKFSWYFLIADVEWDTSNGFYYGWSTTNNALNWYVWTGFVNELQNNATNVEVYSSPSLWQAIMAGRSITQAEWSSENDYGPENPCPTSTFANGPGGYSAAFFGGMAATSNNALSWQWAISTGDNGLGDVDQTNLGHYNNIFGTSFVP